MQGVFKNSPLGDNREYSHQSDRGYRKKLTNYPLASDTFYRLNQGGEGGSQSSKKMIRFNIEKRVGKMCP